MVVLGVLLFADIQRVSRHLTGQMTQRATGTLAALPRKM
jgi:hypothetical protein